MQDFIALGSYRYAARLDKGYTTSAQAAMSRFVLL